MKKLFTTTCAALTIMTGAVLLVPPLVQAGDINPSAAGSQIVVSQFVQSSSKPAAKQFNLQKGQARLTDMLNQLELHFRKTREKAAALTKVAEMTGPDVVQTIDNYLAQIQTLKSSVGRANTAEDLKTIALQIHNLIMDAKTAVKKTISKRVEIHIEKFTQKIVTGKSLIESARQKLNQLKTQGADIQEMNDALSTCQNLMAQGEQKLQDAKIKFQQVQALSSSEQDQGSELLNEGMETVKEARETYGQARQNCSAVIRDLRMLR